MTTLELTTQLIMKTNTNLPLMRKELGLLLRAGQHTLLEILAVDLFLHRCFPYHDHPYSITAVKSAIKIATSCNNDLSSIGRYLKTQLNLGTTELEMVMEVGGVFHYWFGSPETSPLQKHGFFDKKDSIVPEMTEEQEQKVMP